MRRKNKDSVKALLGFRRWKIPLDDSPQVEACISSYTWRKSENISRCDICNFLGYKSPSEFCHCGFNAWFDLQDAKQNYSGRYTVLGAIAGAGQVQIHSQGFRSEKAQILAFLFIPNSSEFSYHRNIAKMLYAKRFGADRALEVFQTEDEDRIIAEKKEQLNQIGKHYGVPVFYDEQKFLDFVEQYARNVEPEDVDSLTRQSKIFRSPLYPFVSNFVIGVSSAVLTFAILRLLFN